MNLTIPPFTLPEAVTPEIQLTFVPVALRTAELRAVTAAGEYPC